MTFKIDLNTLVLKGITPDDIDELHRISIQTYKDQFEKDNNPLDFKLYIEEAFSKQHLLEEIRTQGSSFYFAYHGEHLIAYIKINIGTAQTDIFDTNAIELQRIYVYKSFQKIGVGAYLIDQVKEKAKRKGYKYLWLGVWEKNLAAIRFYRRLGFIKFDSHSFMMGNDEQTDILMKYTII